MEEWNYRTSTGLSLFCSRYFNCFLLITNFYIASYFISAYNGMSNILSLSEHISLSINCYFLKFFHNKKFNAYSKMRFKDLNLQFWDRFYE